MVLFSDCQNENSSSTALGTQDYHCAKKLAEKIFVNGMHWQNVLLMKNSAYTIFDVLGSFSPVITKMKILQQLWERKIDWDEPVPQEIHDAWLQWNLNSPLTQTNLFLAATLPREQISSQSNHRFSDALKDAYAGVVYMCMVDSN